LDIYCVMMCLVLVAVASVPQETATVAAISVDAAAVVGARLRVGAAKSTLLESRGGCLSSSSLGFGVLGIDALLVDRDGDRGGLNDHDENGNESKGGDGLGEVHVGVELGWLVGWKREL
jgi:hypothetical protein